MCRKGSLIDPNCAELRHVNPVEVQLRLEEITSRASSLVPHHAAET